MIVRVLCRSGDHVFISVFIVIYGYLLTSVATWIGILTTTECEKFEGKLPNADVLFKFIEKYIKPFGNLASPVPIFRTHNDASRKEMFQKIDNKINSLKQYLQDNDTNDDPDTTIIEFHPRAFDDSDPANSNVTLKLYRFKKIRDIIKVNLDKEMVSDKTKKIVIKTLDTLISQLSKSKCTQSNGGDSVITFRNRNSKNLNITMNDWKNITNMYFNNINENKTNDSESLLAKVEELNEFFINIMNDTVHYNKKQKLKCELVEAARPDIEETDINSCAHYKICSDELKVFMKDFYDATKRSVDSTFENYGAMYLRDSNIEDVEERNTVEKVISTLRQTFRERIDKIMEKYVVNFRLDEKKDRDINIARIDTYVKDITSQVNKNVKQFIDNEMNDMAPLRARTVLSVQDDIIANIEHDLVSLENDFVGKNCRYFNTCNGKAKNSKGKRRANDDLFVNLKLSVDDEFKDILNSDSLLPYLKPANRGNADKKPNYDQFKTIKVTRTTPVTTEATEIAQTYTIEEIIPIMDINPTTAENKILGNPFRDLANRSIEISLKIM